MATTQIGYFGRTGPVFIDDSTVSGKKILLQGQLINGVMKLVAKQPAYAGNLLGSSVVLSDYTLGPYTDNQTVGDAPAYVQPATGLTFDTYLPKASDWVTANSTAGNDNSSAGSGSGSGSSGSGSGSSGSGSGGSGSGGDTGGTVTYKAATIGEQISTFLSNYWWVVVILALLLLWNPVIAPALGMGKKRKRSYR